MKTFRTTAGPFSERPHYTHQDIESICTDELRKAAFFPERPEPIRIDRFLEKRFGITPEYEPLGELVLGYTRFGAKGPVAVVVSRALDEEGTVVANRRIRTTLAHEVGHILLQGHLFSLEAKPTPLFPTGAGVTATQILCRTGSSEPDSPPGYGYDGRWWEYQANRAIGSLLLPRSLVLARLESFLVEEGSLGIRTLDPGRRSEVQVALVEAFDVNPVVARLRVEEIWPAAGDRQLRL